MTTSVLIEGLVRLAVFVTIAAAFLWCAARLRAVWGLAALVGLWGAAALAYGYISYRVVCSRPVTCDVVFPSGHYYLWHVAPSYAIVGAVGFGLGAAYVLLRGRRSDPRSWRLRTWVGGICLVLLGWTVSLFLVESFISW